MSDTSDFEPSEQRSGRLFVWSNGLQGVGDQLVSGKTVLPWLFGAAGVPGFFTGLLVPIRESGSMLPQAAITPWVTSRKSRKKVWILGAVIQALAAAAIAIAALTLSGTALGLSVIILLAILAGGRALCSISSKDVQGRTISKGHRGLITGRATALAGLVTLVLGIFLWFVEPTRELLAILIGVGALGWAVAVFVFSLIDEPTSEVEEQSVRSGWWKDTWKLFADDKRFRSFVIVRSLLLVSALSTTFIVTLSQDIGQDISGLGTFVVASAAASLVAGRVSGLWSDSSSRTTMAAGSGVASVVILLVVAAAYFSPEVIAPFALPIGFFLVQLAHTAVRVARKTYLVDMAEGDLRTRYTGAANTLMGVFLLFIGVISGAIATFGSAAALLFLAAMGLIGVFMSARLEDVSHA